ncbi:sulfotransferase family protein [Gymnodinialimonas sp.]
MKLCIVGTGRCGTTLLWRMLNDHPDLFVFKETHWLPALHESFGTLVADTSEMLGIVNRTHFVTGQPTTDLDVDAYRRSPLYSPTMTVPEFADSLGRFFARAQGKPGWADKTPDYGYFLSTIQMYWPGCRIVHVIRDGVRTATSMSRHPGYQALAAMGRTHWSPLALDYQPPVRPFAKAPAGAYSKLWYDRLMRIRDEATRLRPGSYIEVRYEDLQKAPKEELSRIARFADLREDKAWLRKAAGQVRTRTAAPRRVDDGMRDFFEASHLRLLEDLGYSIET